MSSFDAEYMSEIIRDTDIVLIGCLYVIYSTVSFQMTLSDLAK